MKYAALLGVAAASLTIAACGSDAPVSASGSAATTSGAGTGTGSGSGSGTGGAGGSTSSAVTGAGGATATSTSATTSVTTSSSTAGGGGSGGFTTIFTILLENHDYNEVVGSADAPYLNSLIAQGGLATNYMDSGTHPSLPNYLYLISGDTQYPGIIDVNPDWVPYFPSSGDNLGNQMTQAGVKWRSYQEDSGTACNLDTVGNYAPKHDPFLYFDNIQNGPNSLCALTNVDYAQRFAVDLAAGDYRYMWITPNLINDGHDPALDPVTGMHQTDAWLATEVPKILASATYQAGGVIFITWDEAEGRNGNSKDQVPMIILSPKLESVGMTSATPLDHGSYLATVEDIFNLPRLGAAASATSLAEFFSP